MTTVELALIVIAVSLASIAIYLVVGGIVRELNSVRIGFDSNTGMVSAREKYIIRRAFQPSAKG